MNDPQTAYYSEYKDTLRYEYDGAGLLVKATGGAYDSSWSNYQSGSYGSERRSYTHTYTNKDGKLMSFKVNALTSSSAHWNNTNTYNSKTKTDGTYTFEYNKNFANKTNDKNAWILVELEVFLFNYKYPLIKTYSTLPDKFSYASRTTDAETGDLVSEGQMKVL